MSCKYCKPLESTGETEPLLRWGDVQVRIAKNKLRLCEDGVIRELTIDFCPNCGDDLTPFGSLLFSRYGGE